MKTIGNLLWLVLCGAWMGAAWLIVAFFFAITIIGIPFAVQCLKLAQFSFWPFGRTIVQDPTASSLGVIGGIIWFIPGLILAVGYVVCGALLCITIIGIPFGIQAIKMAGLALAPFGKAVVPTKDLQTFYTGTY